MQLYSSPGQVQRGLQTIKLENREAKVFVFVISPGQEKWLISTRNGDNPHSASLLRIECRNLDFQATIPKGVWVIDEV